MKTLRKLTTTLFLLCMAGMTMAQDVIVMKDQSTVMSKVLEITSTEIKYKKWNHQEGPTYSVLRSEVVSINYENGEVEKFSDDTINQSTETHNTSKGFMEFNGYRRLKLNGRVLTDEEVRGLVDEQNYQLYLKGKRQNTIGIVIAIPAAIAFSTGIIGASSNQAAISSTSNVQDPATRKMFITIAIVGAVAAIPAVALGIIGPKNIKQVADNYNKAQGISCSLNISPSLMHCEIPQSQGNCGLGLTLSLNF